MATSLHSKDRSRIICFLHLGFGRSGFLNSHTCIDLPRTGITDKGYYTQLYALWSVEHRTSSIKVNDQPPNWTPQPLDPRSRAKLQVTSPPASGFLASQQASLLQGGYSNNPHLSKPENYKYHSTPDSPIPLQLRGPLIHRS